MTKTEAVNQFKEEILPGIIAQESKRGYVDAPMRAEAWNNFTDALCKEKRITRKQYESWTNPF